MSTGDVVEKRWLGFLIWQSIAAYAGGAAAIVLRRPASLALALLSLLSLHLSLFLLSLGLYLLSSPHPDPAASLPTLLRAALFLPSSPDLRRRVLKTLAFVAFLVLCGVSGFLSAVSVCGGGGELSDWGRFVEMGCRGVVFGLVYGAHYVFRRRWILRFPIIQRPLFFSFKMGLSSSLRRALKLSTQAFFFSAILMVFLPDKFKSKSTLGKYLILQIKLYIGISAVSFCWELSHHLLQVVHTRRCVFAPTQGSAAAETNPSEVLLETLEQSSPRSLLQYLAYLDLCMVAESNVEAWRRAAFYEESGETYRRVVSVCLRPLEQFTSRLSEYLEGVSADNSDLFSQQLNLPTDIHHEPKLLQAFDDFQICTWCARTFAALIARSHSEDRYGVAQLTGCNATVISMLLSCLLAVEACLGKKTSPQPAHLMGPGSIRWSAVYTTRKNEMAAITSKRRGGDLHDKAYAMSDVLRTSIYQIVTAFMVDIQTYEKASVLEKNWIIESKPLYSTREILVQKLRLFLEFQAT